MRSIVVDPLAPTTLYVLVEDVGAFTWLPVGGAASPGFRYLSRTRTPDGLERVVLRSGAKSRIVARGRGLDLDLPSVALVPPVRLQVVRSDTSSPCWEAVFPTPIRNDPGHFEAR